MASFPELRPYLGSAHAECWAVPCAGTFVLPAVASVSLTAFTAVSELATLRGAKASDERRAW
jgi:hypothetical protein